MLEPERYSAGFVEVLLEPDQLGYPVSPWP